MARTVDFEILAASAAFGDPAAVAAGLCGRRFGVGTAVDDEERRHARSHPRFRRCASDEVPIEIRRQRGHRGLAIEAADKYRTDHTRGTRFGDQGRQLCAGIFAEQHEPIGIDAELRSATPDEGQRGAHVRERILEFLKPAEPVIEGEPVVSGACQDLENLPDMCDAAA
jgi:hypothetical protein